MPDPTPILDRVAAFLRRHPREALVIAYKPPRDDGPGDFLVACEFGEEMPEAAGEARRAAVRDVLEEALPPHADVDDLVVAIEKAIADVNLDVLAAGAIYGAEDTIDAALDVALKDARA